MSIDARITRLPRPFDLQQGREARGLVPGLSGAVAELVEGAGGSSPYLFSLIQKEALWLEEAILAPEAALAELLHALSEIPLDQVASRLREGKRRVALLVALADLSGVWPLERVTGALTEFADAACGVALRAGLASELRRGKVPGQTLEDLHDGAGMCVLAMGKMGAHELNYSSDIDLICLFDETRFDPGAYSEARMAFVRATRRMAATLGDMTGEGYVFRTDLRLRPDPAVTPVCLAMAAAERYYESLGRTWERAAYIKARPAAGDLRAGEDFLTTLRPFVWRRHLDFAAIQDAHDMRLRIREHKGLGGPITLPGHNMKLGRGGIREIEFFTQTRQLIAGGREPSLRVRDTVGALGRLAEGGWVPPETAEKLVSHYEAHRLVEHRIQMVNDAQTHDLPGTGEGFERLACLMGLERGALERELHERLSDVHECIESFFAPAPQQSDAPRFDKALRARWRSYPAFRSPRAVSVFARLEPEFLRRLARAADPQQAINALDGFLRGLPAGVQLFSLFEANPQLIDLLVDILATAPALAEHLARNARVFDAVIGGSFFAPWPGAQALEAELGQRLARETDYERQLDAARRWAKEWHFRIGVHHLRGIISGWEAGGQYSDLAGACLRALWPRVQEQFAIRHGQPPGRGAVVLGMGSLGAGRLNAASDLDLIVIYDAQDVETSQGRRGLNSRTYYARLTQAFVTALSAPMAEGRLYEVDMRLRPSGTQGPVATSWQSFQSYQREQAWLWEHLALTRARVVVGRQSGLGEDVAQLREEIITMPRKHEDIIADTGQMRQRIRAAKRSGGVWDFKLGPGRLQDIELLAQAALLASGSRERDIFAGLQQARTLGWLAADSARDTLIRAYELCWDLQAATRLLTQNTFEPDLAGQGACEFFAKAGGAATLADLSGEITAITEESASLIERALPVAQSGAQQDQHGP